VAVGSLKVTVPQHALSVVTESDELEPVGWQGGFPEVEASSQIDIRGVRADEAESLVMQAIDAAVQADLRSLRIIHGKGTGALRDRVSEMLRKDTRVRGFRLGAWNEGGAGVTVAELS